MSNGWLAPVMVGGRPRGAVVSVLVLALGIGACLGVMTIRPSHVAPAAVPISPRQRYELSVVNDAGCYYQSVFAQGAIPLPARGDRSDSIAFTSAFEFEDGCTWESREELTPIGNGGYHYVYSERPVRCAEDHMPAAACRRNGAVYPVTP